MHKNDYHPSLTDRPCYKTALRAGQEANNMIEAAFFAVLDALQKPTEWLYSLTNPDSKTPSKGG